MRIVTTPMLTKILSSTFYYITLCECMPHHSSEFTRGLRVFSYCISKITHVDGEGEPRETNLFYL